MLKKTISIVFLALLFLNVLGYYGLFLGLRIHNDREMVQRLDSDDFNASETVTIKIPLTVPYGTDSKVFSRVDGTFEHNGGFYRLVKQALLKDTLHIVCVKDLQGKRIHDAMTSYIKTFADKPSGESQHALTFSDFIKDYLTTSVSITNDSFGWQREISNATQSPFFQYSYQSSVIHPPERT